MPVKTGRRTEARYKKMFLEMTTGKQELCKFRKFEATSFCVFIGFRFPLINGYEFNEVSEKQK